MKNRGTHRLSIALTRYVKNIPAWLVELIFTSQVGLLKFYLVISVFSYMVVTRHVNVLELAGIWWHEHVRYIIIVPAMLQAINCSFMIKGIHWAAKRASTKDLEDVSIGNAFQMLETLFLVLACVWPLQWAIVFLILTITYNLYVWKLKKTRRQNNSRSSS